VLRPRPAPSTRLPQRKLRQMSENRCQMSDGTEPDHGSALLAAASDSNLPIIASWDRGAGTAPPMLAHRPRIPMPRPDLTPRGDGRTCFTVTTRFTMS